MSRPINRPKATNVVFENEIVDYANDLSIYADNLEKYCDELEKEKEYSLSWKNEYIHRLENRLRSLDIDINPCRGCTDYCYKNDCCKSNGACGNKELDAYIKRLEEENECYNEIYNECKIYTRAFERACFELEYSNKQLRDLDKGFPEMNSDYWKDYILSEEVSQFFKTLEKREK